ncbi:MAG TPA: hypothetical protein VGH56_01705, partial [Solirubrobacteraceae bacterium]
MSTHPTFGEQDHNSRYEAVVKLIERGLADAANARQSRLPGLYATVATNALEALEGEPSEPKLLNLAGVALYELWSLDAAQQLFEAALRLDPALGEVQRNLAQLAQRRRSLRGRKQAGMLHPSVGELER